MHARKDRQNISLRPVDVGTDELGHTVATMGVQMATVKETVMDLDFVKRTRDTRVYVDGRDLPGSGLYMVDRANGRLVDIDEKTARILEWHEKLRVGPMPILAPLLRGPIVLFIDFHDPSELSLGCTMNRVVGFVACKVPKDRVLA